MYTSASDTPAEELRNTQPWRRLYTYMQTMIELGAVIVVPSGNMANKPGHTTAIDTLPALYAAELPIVVVGAVSNTGDIAPFSQGPAGVSVWAPGVDVECVAKGQDFDSGTSYSTGMVSFMLPCSEIGMILMRFVGRWVGCLFPGNGQPSVFSGSRCNSTKCKDLFATHKLAKITSRGTKGHLQSKRW